MRPPSRPKTDYEKIAVDTWIPGIIEDVTYDMQRKRIWEGKEKIGPAVRFKFKLEGYSFPHYSGWLSFSYGEKTSLYKKYLTSLVENVQPDMDSFDLDSLKGMKIKTMWETRGEYQNIQMIRPLAEKIKSNGKEPLEPTEDTEIPF